MERYSDDQLIAELRALRPLPGPAFAAKLDERAAAGFPRRSPLDRLPLGRLAARLRAVSLRRLALPAGAAALVAVAAATAVVATTELGTGGSRPAQLDRGAESTGAAERAPGDAATARSRPLAPAGGSAGRALAPASADPLSAGPGPFASKAGSRRIERSAELVLGADPADVGDLAAKVFGAVHAANGIVLSSSIRAGEEGEAGAQFDLLIPAARLGDALAAFSSIAEVRSRHEATRDITAPTIGLRARLRDSRARIEGLLAQLARADTGAERAATEAELRAERRHAALLRARLAALRRRANLARVSLRIETGAGSAASGKPGGAWGTDEALDDAGQILAIAAGVAIVGLAIVGPLVLIGLLAWLANRVRVRRARERTLG